PFHDGGSRAVCRGRRRRPDKFSSRSFLRLFQGAIIGGAVVAWHGHCGWSGLATPMSVLFRQSCSSCGWSGDFRKRTGIPVPGKHGDVVKKERGMAEGLVAWGGVLILKTTGPSPIGGWFSK